MSKPLSPALRKRLHADFNSSEAEPPGEPAPSNTSPSLPEHPIFSPMNSQVGGTHYKNLAIQPVEFITANGLAFLEGCVIKRMCRHSSKNGIEDLRKAIHEIQLLAELTYGVTL